MKKLDIRLNLQLEAVQHTNGELMLRLIQALDNEFVNDGLSITNFNALEIVEKEESPGF